MLKSSLIALALVFPVLGCGAEQQPAPAGSNEGAKAETVALDSATRELRCGCKIDGIGTCGNYVAEGDDWLEISNPEDHGLGGMEWCAVPAKVHVMGEVAGERTGDVIQVTTLLVDQ